MWCTATEKKGGGKGTCVKLLLLGVHLKLVLLDILYTTLYFCPVCHFSELIQATSNKTIAADRGVVYTVRLEEPCYNKLRLDVVMLIDLKLSFQFPQAC